MRRATLILVAALGLFIAWVALRDWRPVDPGRVAARSAAAQLDATVLDRRGANVWRIEIVGAVRARCFDVDVRRFGRDPAHGYRGLRAARCPSR